jgi:hypothetical protein
MGYRAENSAEEDILCARMIAAELNNEKFIPVPGIPELQYGSGSRFFIPENLEFSPPTDFFLCTMVNRFDFVLKATRRFDGNIDLMKIDL